MSAVSDGATTTGRRQSGLTRLADAAARIGRRRGRTVVIVRELGTAGVEQAASLRAELARRGLRVLVLTPPEVVDSAHRIGPAPALVIDLGDPAVGEGHLIAAHLRIPLLAIDREHDFVGGADTARDERSSDAIAMAASNYNDTALAHTVVAPLGTGPSAVNIQVDHRVIHLRQTEIRVRLQRDFLEVDARTSSGLRKFRGPRCHIEPVTGRFLVLRDGTRTAELRGMLTTRIWTRRFTAHLLRP
jgi:hypothetical protein